MITQALRVMVDTEELDEKLSSLDEIASLLDGFPDSVRSAFSDLVCCLLSDVTVRADSPTAEAGRQGSFDLALVTHLGSLQHALDIIPEPHPSLPR